MELRPASGAGEWRRVKQWQGKRAECNEVRGKGTILLLYRDCHQYRVCNISAGRKMADGVAIAGGVRLILMAGEHIWILGKLGLMFVCG